MQLAKALSDDAKNVKAWLQIRELDTTLADHLPHIGFVALYDEEPIAAGYLRLVEGGTGMIDSLITNPNAPSLKRHEAIDAIVRELISTAKGIGLHSIIAYSVDEGTLERSVKFGFKRAPYVIISLNIKE